MSQVDANSSEEKKWAPACKGSGYCCMKAPCWVSKRVYGEERLREEGRCPALIWDEQENRYFCEQAKNDPEIAKELSVNVGCSSSLNTFRKNVLHRPKIKFEWV